MTADPTPDEIAQYWKKRYREEITEPSLERVACVAAFEQANFHLWILKLTESALALLNQIDSIPARSEPMRLERAKVLSFSRINNAVLQDEVGAYRDVLVWTSDAGPSDSALIDKLVRAFRYLAVEDEFRERAPSIVAKLERAWPIPFDATPRVLALWWVVDQVKAWIEEHEPERKQVWRDIARCLEWYGHDLAAETHSGQPREGDDLRKIWDRH